MMMKLKGGKFSIKDKISLSCLYEDMFFDKFISKFKDNAYAFLMAYKGHHLEV